jgi:hypothetical protein
MDVYILEHGQRYEGTYGTWVFATNKAATKRLKEIAKDRGDHNPRFDSSGNGLSYFPTGEYGEGWWIDRYKVIEE